MTVHHNPADLRREARAAVEARISAGRPFRAGESRGMGVIVAIAILFGGVIPVATAFARPFVSIAAEMADFAPAGLLLVALLVGGRALLRRRSRRATLGIATR